MVALEVVEFVFSGCALNTSARVLPVFGQLDFAFADGRGASCGVGLRSSFFDVGVGFGDFLFNDAVEGDCFFGISLNFRRSAKG